MPQIPLTLGGWKALNRVSQHRPRHAVRATVEEPSQGGAVTLAGLSQHPADGLVDQVVLVGQQQVRDAERVVEIALPDEVQRRHDRDTPLPQHMRLREAPKRCATAILKVSAHDLRRGQIDEVPVVDERGAVEIQLVNPGASGRVGASKRLDQQHQRQRTLLVNARAQERPDLRQRKIAAFAADGAQRGNPDADEDVARAVFAGAGLEESLEDRRTLGIRCSADAGPRTARLTVRRTPVVTRPTA